MQTSLAGTIRVNPPSQVEQNCLTYANFTTPTKPFTGHPHILTQQDWSWLQLRPEYFARKFDARIDAEILNTIDKTGEQNE